MLWEERKKKSRERRKETKNHPIGRFEITVDPSWKFRRLTFFNLHCFLGDLALSQIQMSTAMLPTINRRPIVNTSIRKRRKSINTSTRVTNTSINVIRGGTRTMRVKMASLQRRSLRLQTSF